MLPSTNLVETARRDTAEKRYDLSVVVVSFNTREVLRACLRTLENEAEELALEILLVDNGSRDASLEMVQEEFPGVRLIHAGVNLGFAAANNLMFRLARGRYIVLLNSDAFLQPGALRRALDHMEAEPSTGLGGGRLIGEDGTWQPSARLFPSLLNDFLSLSGIAHRFPKSRFFGRADRTWADPLSEAETDWVPGAFSIVRAELLQKVDFFDPSFFLYYEEVDLCRRIKAAGFAVRYWPDVVVVHLGGESSKAIPHAARSSSGAQLTLWRLRSGFLYYRKHHGAAARLSMALEYAWHQVRIWKNGFASQPDKREKADESRKMVALVQQAWKETQGGRVSPPVPW